jgi:hypothetical protein
LAAETMKAAPAAFEAIAATLRLGSVGFEREADAKGERQV